MTPKSNTPFWLQPSSPQEASCARLLWPTTEHTSHWTWIHTHTNTRRHEDGTQSSHKTITQSSHGGTQADRPSRSHALATASHASCVPRECSVMLTSLRCLIHAIARALWPLSCAYRHTGQAHEWLWVPPESSHCAIYRSLWCCKALGPS